MNVSEKIVSYARVELAEQYREFGVVPQELFDEALAAAKEFTESRSGYEVSEEQMHDAALQLETLFNVYVGNEHLLVNNEGHVEWLETQKNEISWEYWSRYRQWLIEDEHRPETVIDGSLHPITDRILGMLEDPRRPGAWSRRGLVAGQVQSGKTSNYVGLINKALDAGYKLVIVLAGTHDNLRSQTQLRINSGVLGFNTQGNINGSLGMRVGVGLKDARKPRINCPTSSDQKGDFNRRLAQGVGALGGDPVILVVKKNTAILKNLYAWSTGLHHELDPETGQKIVRNVPMLLIDDEADHASIDTGSIVDKVTGDESSPSATNALIRQLLNAFEKTAYVGYTATPFANIFINPSADHEIFGKGLFPEHFIVTLPETSAYSGPAKIFGLKEDDSAGVEGVEALPTNREVKDYDSWLPDGHKKGELPKGPLPKSVREAICSFVLSSAVKRARRARMKHNSMLLHVTKYVDVQTAVAEQVTDFVLSIRNEILYLPAEGLDTQAWLMLRDLYEGDFRATHELMEAQGTLDAQSSGFASFVELQPFIEQVVGQMQVKAINGEAKDALLYEENPDGITVIAVGGDKLSRGLTLEGLTTSYYLRASKMYDTLMQMGRWFGYRPGYLDVCRLYTTEQLVRWYRRITGASERLYKEFELMAALGKTPIDFGLRVQSHPDGLMVTAANKSRFAKNIRASFSGTITETILFVDDEIVRKRNVAALTTLLESMKNDPHAVATTNRKHYWRGVRPTTILAFLDGYDAHRGAYRALPAAMSEYVRSCNGLEDSELTTWDVYIASKDGAGEELNLPNDSFGLIERNPDTRPDGNPPTYVIGRLVSSADELFPIKDDAEEMSRALQQAISNWEGSSRVNKAGVPTAPTALAERRIRSPKRGYLLIYPLERDAAGLDADETPYVGFAIAFPWSEEAPSVNYRVNEIYWDLEMVRAFQEADDNDD
ncbi:endonuclease [Salinibacterium xinjiangense]|uniref:Z1 domain-containing protein n=1 Tax=Salinibacterium xinjiangense TaxID=386302 RepID=A0A2C8ZBD8_9MICO|nr:Z1 domain-containing protein [Salinibacterium xinjiangense]GGK90152.1 endonuclease [Salinibacterium xinjiangense]SOE61379.1 Z1 domain-containing protein [Salinibacterium xinjiangense]